MKRVIQYINQNEFATILYDSLFGLVLFFSLDSFLEITNATHFVFYTFSTIVVIHWWLLFRSAGDMFQETRRSALYILLNLMLIIFLEFSTLYSRIFDYEKTVWLLLAVLGTDLLWTIFVRQFHQWKSSAPSTIRVARSELNNIILSNASVSILFGALLGGAAYLSASWFVTCYITIYLLYIALSFRLKIIDLQII